MVTHDMHRCVGLADRRGDSDAPRAARPARRLGVGPGFHGNPAGALLDAQRCLAQQMEALAAARALCHHAPAPRARHHPPLGAFTTDLRGAIMSADPSIGALLGRAPEGLFGASLAALVALPDRRRFGHHLCELIENPDRGEWQTRFNREGSLITISVALRIEVLPGYRLLQWFVRDLRELRRAQTEVLAREESVRGATRLLRRLARENTRLRRRLDGGQWGVGQPGRN